MHYYKPGSAATNRILAYAMSFAELNKRVVLVLGTKHKTSLPVVDGIKIHGVVGSSHMLALKMSQVVKRSYDRKSSAIIVYGTPIFCLFLEKRKFNIFYECTEVPFYGRRGSIIQRIIEYLKLMMAKRSTGMLVISKSLKQYFYQRGVNNIEIINMFVDNKRFDELSIKDHNCENSIAYCGTISLYKDGVDCLIQAFALFAKQHPEYKLKLIGKFDNESTETILKEKISQLHLEGKVIFCGLVPPSEMPVLLSRSKVLALARPNNEQAKYGFPTKLGEYLATGNPVVVTDVGEIGDFLQHGNNCIMSRPDDYNDFADKLLWVVNNYQEAIKIGAKGKSLTQNAFSSVEQSKKVLAFISKSDRV